VFACAFFLAAAADSRATHVSCGQTITTDTTLDSDLDCPTLPRLNIGAVGITLDLGGHTLQGRVRNLGFDDVRIVNGVIIDKYFPTAAITLRGVSRNEIRDVTVDNGSVRVSDSSDIVIAGLSGTGPGAADTDVVLSGSPGISFAGGRWLTVSAGNQNRFEGLRDSNVSAGNENRFEGLRDSNLDAFSDNVFGGNEGGSIFVRGDRNDIVGNHIDSVSVHEGDVNTITDNSLTTALGVQFSSSNVIERNRVATTTSSSSAMFLFQVTSTLVVDNEISGPVSTEGEDGNRPSGIWMANSGDNLVSGNIISGRARGIQMTGANGNTVIQNRIDDAGTSGIVLYISDTNEVSRNRVSGAGEHGIELLSFSDDNRVERNTAIRSSLDGITIRAGQGVGNLLSRNFVRFNRDDGIGVDQAGNTVTRNQAVRNFDWGIEAVEGTLDGGGNNASANGQRAQCLNVTCRRR
jgi:parallel beta-helix repeat protein